MTLPLPISVIGVATNHDELLVIRRSEHVIAPGQICFPGGGLERTESEESGLKREFFEELGVEIFPQRRVWQSVAPWQVDLRWWLIELPDKVQLQPNPREIAACWWESPEQLLMRDDLLESNRYFLEEVLRGGVSLAGGESSNGAGGNGSSSLI